LFITVFCADVGLVVCLGGAFVKYLRFRINQMTSTKTQQNPFAPNVDKTFTNLKKDSEAFCVTTALS
jgi:hypothetical protein